MAADIIDIANIASEKEKLRNTMILERLQKSNHHSLLTEYEIREMTSSLRRTYIKPEVVASVLRKLSRSLRKQYKQLSDIFEQLR